MEIPLRVNRLKLNKTLDRKSPNGVQILKVKPPKRIGVDLQKILKKQIQIFGKNMKKNFGKITMQG